MRIQRKAGSAYINLDEQYEFSVVHGRPPGAEWSGADNPVGTYDFGDSLLLVRAAEPQGSVLIRNGRDDLLEACIFVIKREIDNENPHIKTHDVLTEAYKVLKAAA